MPAIGVNPLFIATALHHMTERGLIPGRRELATRTFIIIRRGDSGGTSRRANVPNP